MNSITTRNELPALAIFRLAWATVVLIFTVLALSVQTHGQEAPTVRSFPIAESVAHEWRDEGAE